ncbi:MAG: extracellular solute-binding protein [Actinobacteria bacterium]|nr:extracellular solute-binding protein [Actinomycetota bacterium]
MLRFAALGAAAALALTACSSGGGTDSSSASGTPEAATIKLWLAGGDTPDELREYLKTEFAKQNPGSTLVIEQQDWGDLVTKLTTALPDKENTPDVVELGNTQSSTFTNVGAFLDISDMYDELGGDKLLPSFVEAGEVDGKNYTLPYYFGSRYVFYRADLWAAAGVTAPPATLAEFNADVAKIATADPNGISNLSGFWLGGQDWRNAISWIFANGGELAVKDGDTWTSTMSDPKTQEGLKQLQELWTTASKAPRDATDANTYNHLNDADSVAAEDGSTTAYSLDAATIMAPGWAHWSIGDLVTVDGKDTREWNDSTFGVFPLPGVDGGYAPVFAGGSNIGISAASQHPELAKSLMKIIFSPEYQQMLGKNGLGPANADYVSSLGDDQFAKALINSALNSKLTPAAPGWAALESSKKLEEFFQKISQGADIAATAKEFDAQATPILNAKS